MSTQGEAQVENQAQQTEEKKRVSVFNLPPGISRADDLRDLCKEYGPIQDVEFYQARGEKAAFGFVTYKTSVDAKYAAYMLRDKNFGGKHILKVGLSDNTKKRTNETPVKKPKVKKQMTSLVTLTPKNPATNAAPPQGDIPVKKTWDLSNLQTAQQKQTAPQQNKRQGPKNPGQGQGQNPGQRKNNNNQGQAQGQTQQSPPQHAEKKSQNQQAQVTPPAQNQGQKPAGQAPAQQQAPAGQAPGVVAPQGPGQKKKNNNRPKKNPQAEQPPAPLSQQAPAPVQPAVTPVVQPAKPSPQQKQQQKQLKKQAAAAGPVAFNIVVVEVKTNTTFHNVGVTQIQYDQHIAPLIRR
jgi:hypothetical protein